MSPPRDPVRLSVIVPFHDNPDAFEQCLAALARSSAEFELILVDDASTGPRAIELARSVSAVYVRLDVNSGPAVARNAGLGPRRSELLLRVASAEHPRVVVRLLRARALRGGSTREARRADAMARRVTG